MSTLWNLSAYPFNFSFLYTVLALSPIGTSGRWVLGWSATTFPAWWTSSVSCASGTRTWCSPSARGPKSGSESASTSSDTTAGTAARWTATTRCLAGWCCEVSLLVCDRDFYLCGFSACAWQRLFMPVTLELIILVNVSAVAQISGELIGVLLNQLCLENTNTNRKRKCCGVLFLPSSEWGKIGKSGCSLKTSSRSPHWWCINSNRRCKYLGRCFWQPDKALLPDISPVFCSVAWAGMRTGRWVGKPDQITPKISSCLKWKQSPVTERAAICAN